MMKHTKRHFVWMASLLLALTLAQWQAVAAAEITFTVSVRSAFLRAQPDLAAPRL